MKHEELKRWCVYINLHIVKLNKKYKVVGESKTLKLHTEPSTFIDKHINNLPKGHHCEDPRLFIYRNKLHLIYTDGFKQLLALINLDSLDVEYSNYIEKPFETQFEKNWSPLVKNNDLYFIHTYSPYLTIFKMKNNAPMEIQEINVKKNNLNKYWSWGQIRGGTPFIETHDNKYYITIFHSSKNLTPLIEYSKIYVAGILLLDKEFNPVAISKFPLIRGEIQSYTKDRLNKNIFVVFPCGLIFDINKDKYICSFGYNDTECRILEINSNNIYNELNWFN